MKRTPPGSGTGLKLSEKPLDGNIIPGSVKQFISNDTGLSLCVVRGHRRITTTVRNPAANKNSV